jgi:hypothetical protein
MTKNNNPKAKAKPRYRVGDKVKFLSMNDWVLATITEDRGNLGVKGRRLYGLHFSRPYNEQPIYIEMPEEELEPAT